MAVRRTSNSHHNSNGKLTGRLLLHNLPLLLLLLTFTAATTTSGAVLPPSARPTSSSSSSSTSATQSSANQRSERSAAALLEDTSGSRASSSGGGSATSRSEAGDSGVEKRKMRDANGCSSDFVENFFRLLSGPVGKEAEALVAAVLKLVSENDRVNWPALAAKAAASTAMSEDVSSEVHPSSSPSSAFAPSTAFAQPRGPFLPGGVRSGLYNLGARPGLDQQGSKRGAPKFNPTGWRRKRSASFLPLAPMRLYQRPVSEATVQQLIRLLAKSISEEQDQQQQQQQQENSPSKFFDLGDEDSEEVELPPEMQEWRNHVKRDGLETVLLRRRQLKPKRKPLEFNPTGW